METTIEKTKKTAHKSLSNGVKPKETPAVMDFPEDIRRLIGIIPKMSDEELQSERLIDILRK